MVSGYKSYGTENWSTWWNNINIVNITKIYSLTCHKNMLL